MKAIWRFRDKKPSGGGGKIRVGLVRGILAGYAGRMRPLTYLATPWTDISRKRSSSGDNVPVLDGVRCLAVLVVVMSHCDFAGMDGQGNIGVLLFFVLSGFVLTLPLIENPGSIYRPDFLLRYALNRTLRIYPAYLVTVFAMVLVFRPWPDGWMIRHLTFQAGWGHLWSVTEEVRFYALFPFVAMMVFAAPRLWMRAVMIFLTIVIARQYESAFLVDRMDGTLSKFFFWFFLTGMLACVLHRSAVAFVKEYPWFAHCLGAIAPAVIAITFLGSNGAIATIWAPLFPRVPPSINGAAQPVMWCVALGLLIVAITANARSLAARFFASRPMRHIGLLSYGIYLFHFPVWMWLTPFGLSPTPLFAACSAITYVIAIASYLLIERPTLLLKTIFRAPALAPIP